MVLGISSFAYGWSVGVPGQMPECPLSPTDLVNRTVDFGLSCLQIGDNLPVGLLNEESRKELRDLLTRNNIRFEIGARKLTAEHLEQYIDLASYFNAPLLRFVVDGDDYEPDSSEIVRIIIKALPTLVKHKIVLGIENHDRFKASELAEIMEAFDHPNVGICLDCVNSLGAGEGLEHVIKILAPYTVNLHIKDFNIHRLSHQMGFNVTGTPAGQGMTNVPRLIEHLSKYERCKSAVLEQWVTPAPSMGETVNKEEQWAIESIQYLKELPYFKNSKLKIIR
ncbi:MAG: sugar phosphate isomerase/epimerase family protein [Chryseolinea sp.]